MKLLILLLLTAQIQAANWTVIRRISQVAMCAASGADAWTTLRPGLVETNPLLGAGQQNRGLIIGVKAGVCVGQVALAEWQHRRYKSAGVEQVNTGASLGLAGVFTGLAVHNSRLKTSSR